MTNIAKITKIRFGRFFMEITTFFKGRLIIETGDITEKKADAIVNAANSSLMGGGGVDGAIHRKGGSQILVECRKIIKEQYPEGLPTGYSVYTKAGLLPADYVIHTVGPIWHGGMQNESEELKNAYLNSLSVARELKTSSIAFPAISTGIYGFPQEKAACIVYDLIKKYIESYNNPEKIFLIFFKKKDVDVFLKNIP